MVALAPPTFAVTEHFPRSCPHISAHLGGWSIPPPPPILSCCVVYILYLDCLSSVDKHIKLFLLWHTYPSTCQIISNKPCIIPSSTVIVILCHSVLKIIWKPYIKIIFCYFATCHTIFFYMVDIILTHHLHAFPNNTLLILFKKNIWRRDGHLKINSLGRGYSQTNQLLFFQTTSGSHSTFPCP